MIDPLVGFLVIFVATFLLAGECLINAKGMFGLIGFLLYILFLFSQLSAHTTFWLIGVLIIGVVCVLIDGLLIANGSVAFIGLLAIMLALAVASPDLTYGIGVCVSYVLGLGASLILLKTFQPRNFWRKLTLFDRSTSEAGYNSMNEKTKRLLGKEGLTISVLRPVGTIEIDGERISAITNGEWVQAGKHVVVTAVDGTKIMVKPLSDEGIDLNKRPAE